MILLQCKCKLKMQKPITINPIPFNKIRVFICIMVMRFVMKLIKAIFLK